MAWPPLKRLFIKIIWEVATFGLLMKGCNGAFLRNSLVSIL